MGYYIRFPFGAEMRALRGKVAAADPQRRPPRDFPCIDRALLLTQSAGPDAALSRLAGFGVIIDGPFAGAKYGVDLASLRFDQRPLSEHSPALRFPNGLVAVEKTHRTQKGLGHVLMAWTLLQLFERYGDNVIITTHHKGTKPLADDFGMRSLGSRFRTEKGVLTEVVAGYASDLARASLRQLARAPLPVRPLAVHDAILAPVSSRLGTAAPPLPAAGPRL